LFGHDAVSMTDNVKCRTSFYHIHRHKAASRDRQELAVMQSYA
jgi:hypothetical protein